MRTPGFSSSSEVDPVAAGLYRAHGRALTQWAHRRFNDAQAAEEVVQETLLSAWRKHDQFDPSRGTERAWIFGIGRNVAATRFARGRRHLRSIPTENMPDDGRDDGGIEQLAERSLIADALRSLSPEHRSVVVAAFWEGLSTRQMAARFAVAEGTVKSRLFYALRALRAALEEREVIG